ncbi:acid-sensing ion channel 3-like isoform X2 [Palaemon carinicauda]|uniref:acid-sensing ion channel 3-like isoform X2 n=1 Tax=Palaemon carinicauda TaxID=392227 RepID=UPI0035B6444D
METVMFQYQQRLIMCDCPPPCRETQYITKITSSEENRRFYTIVQNIKKMSSGSDLCSGSENGTARIHLFLDSLSFETIEESPAYTWDTLICNVGGNLGLFIGMSLVTMVEVLVFLFDILFVWVSSKGKKEAIQVNPQPSVHKGTLQP